MQLISDTLKSAIIEQIAHERYNAHLYMFLCGYLRNKGLDNLAKHFEGQHNEEVEHSFEFFNLLTDLNADIMIPEIEEVNPVINTILEIAQLYLSREVLTTKSITEIRNMAIAEGSSIVEEKMREMIKKQQHEYEEATSFMDKAELLPEWWQCALWDTAK